MPDGQITKNLSSLLPKNISLFPSGKSALPARAIPSRWEGRFAIVMNAGWDAVDAAVRVTSAPMRTAKPCGP